MKVYTIDFETYYDSDYTLSKMSTEDYVNHGLFQIILVGIKVDDQPAYYLTGHHMQDVADHLHSLDLPNNVLLCQNTAFDALILQVHFGIIPALYLDTRLMGRAIILPYVKSVTLSRMAEAFGIGHKGTEVHKARGKLLAHFTQQELKDYAGYCCNDCNLTYALWMIFKPQMPGSELVLIDRLLRMYIEPVLVLNVDVLEDHMANVMNRKEELLERVAELGYEKRDLMSNNKFAEILESFDVIPPTKISPITKKETYAFAKTDEGFKELMDHPDERVQAMCAARIGHKSTLEETRTQRFIDISRKYQKLRVPLLYSAARTHRLGGTEKLNMQNLPARGGNNSLRKSMEAPPGYKILVADQAQIEARLLAYLADQTDLVEQFRAGKDVYSLFANKIYGFDVNAIDNPRERFVGKSGILSLGYGAGANKFRLMLSNFGHIISEQESQTVVDTYRNTYSRIKASWNRGNVIINEMLSGRNILFGNCISTDLHKILLPNGLHLMYLNLREEDGEFGKQWAYDFSGITHHIYGAKLIENIVQALARIIVMDQLITVSKHYKVVHTCHDEIVCVVPDAQVEPASAYIKATMIQPPAWADQLPLNVDVGVGQNYAEAK